jgi:hypothetical protein
MGILNKSSNILKSFYMYKKKACSLQYKGIVSQDLLQRIVKMKKTEIYSSIKAALNSKIKETGTKE